MAKKWLKEKLVDPNLIERHVGSLREKKLSIATLNGSFDLLHAGHLHMIYQAHLQADHLIVCLNTDESIKSYKGKTRPIVSLPYRLEMIAALSFVDSVTFFEETTPIILLEKIKPDVHVNGNEYGENCIEAPTVKKIWRDDSYREAY